MAETLDINQPIAEIDPDTKEIRATPYFEALIFEILTSLGGEGEEVRGVGTGDVSKVGTPVNNQIGVWTGDGTLEGDSNFTWDATTLTVGAVKVTGSFTSLGIDDNGTAEMMQIADNQLTLGPSDTSLYVVGRKSSSGGAELTGGAGANLGGNILLYGNAHTNDGDVALRNDGNTWMEWDETDGEIQILTGVGSKTLALTINSSQNATLAGDITYSGAFIQPPVALANDATPSVAGGRVWLTGGMTTITDFDDGVTGQEIIILSEHAITITDNGNFFLAGGDGAGAANFVMASTDSLHLIQKADGNWYEISRSVN